MNSLIVWLAAPLNALLFYCFILTHNYVVAIALFTLLTKIILFPITCWTHRNGIKMVELMPNLNRLKIKYYGDKDTIAEETQKLYKKVSYHPLVSTVPMIIQLILLFGVIAAVRALLEGETSVYSLLPWEQGGVTLLMPLFAGLAALALGLAQNRLNPLQREQGKASQWMTNGISIAISLFLGAFVPLGVGFYWVFSNLFTIAQQLVLNAIIPPEKYVNYDALADSKKELQGIESLSSQVTPEEKRREKEDFKKFFSVANKHLVFYSESSGFYKYFQNVIEYLLSHSNVIIHYVTSDPNDQIFDLAKSNENIRPYYIGEKRLITLMMKMDADIVVMTMPDLDNYHIKRSYVRKDVEYVYMFHAVFNGLKSIRPRALNHYDTFLTTDCGIEVELKRWSVETGWKLGKLVPCGYGVIDNMAAAYEAGNDLSAKSDAEPIALVAPSWQPYNILESCLVPLCRALLKNGYRVIVRPHPQYIRRFGARFREIQDSCAVFSGSDLSFETDFSSNVTVFNAELLITDWSSIGYEYALATRKPVLFVNTPPKIVNPQCAGWYGDGQDFEHELRRAIGTAISPSDSLESITEAIAQLKDNGKHYAEAIEYVRENQLYHFRESGKYGAKYLLSSLRERQEWKAGA